MLLENFYHSVIVWVENKLSARHWLRHLVLFSLVLSLFLAFPPYNLLKDHLSGAGGKLDAWVFIQERAGDMLHPKGVELDVRRENMMYRFTLPILSSLTGHSVLFILFLQAVLGVLFLYRIGKHTFSLTGDKFITAMWVISVAHIFIGVWFFAEIHGYGDGYAYFCLLAAMLSRNRFFLFIWLMIAFFTDERAVLAGGYLVLWWITGAALQQERFDWKELRRALMVPENIVVGFAWALYLGVRFYLKDHYFADFHYSTVGTPVLFEQAHRNGLGSSLWGVFEGTWLILIAAGLTVWLSRKYLLFVLLAAGFLVMLVSGIFFHDIDRTLSYGFPFLLMAVSILIHLSTKTSLRLILFFCAVICVIHPQLFYMGYNKILWLEPLPLKGIIYLDHLWGWHLFD